ncbi:hypothetical protein GWI33_010296 [Rhynchophorus ferrugineus]|uniref:Uncharacterized protein n=1 Tax=Rhynchophorus ferrugineus TaxID=354439 RepID=A0A834MNG8_RHYFE|nr:hypothetical protein GWI33_010296 [Rhynchophorus ferrugineus]
MMVNIINNPERERAAQATHNSRVHHSGATRGRSHTDNYENGRPVAHVGPTELCQFPRPEHSGGSARNTARANAAATDADPSPARRRRAAPRRREAAGPASAVESQKSMKKE